MSAAVPLPAAEALAAVQKRQRAIAKKIRQIEELSALDKGSLTAEQKIKLASEAELREESASLDMELPAAEAAAAEEATQAKRAAQEAEEAQAAAQAAAEDKAKAKAEQAKAKAEQVAAKAARTQKQQEAEATRAKAEAEAAARFKAEQAIAAREKAARDVAARASALAAGVAPLSPEVEKRVRAVQKKLRQAMGVQEEHMAGKQLSEAQRQKSFPTEALRLPSSMPIKPPPGVAMPAGMGSSSAAASSDLGSSSGFIEGAAMTSVAAPQQQLSASSPTNGKAKMSAVEEAQAALGSPGSLDEASDAEVAAVVRASEAQAGEASAELRALGMDDFELLRLVGKGGYGKVFQVRCKLNQTVYAMKVVDKASIERYRSMDNIATELSILRTHAEARHPFILALECAFQSASKLHFVMEYVPGGMLFAHLRKNEMFSEKVARFYAAEVMLGLEHLHSLSIIYRDLKPENVLICADGNAKLCDFGLAAVGLTASATHISSTGRPVLVGTTEYMAPEVLRRMPCGQAVDVWALGVLLFEMLTGEAPWYHKEQKELQRKIAHTKLRLPTWLTNEAKSIIRGLLTKDPLERLAVTRGSEQNTSDFPALKAHPFFRNLNFRMLLMRKLEAPLIPTLSREDPQLDVTNFDAKYTLEPAVLSPLRRPLSADMESQFEALELEYMSPDVRDSVRHSIRDSVMDGRASMDSRCSERSSRGSGSDSLLRFPPARGKA